MGEQLCTGEHSLGRWFSRSGSGKAPAVSPSHFSHLVSCCSPSVLEGNGGLGKLRNWTLGSDLDSWILGKPIALSLSLCFPNDNDDDFFTCSTNIN